MSEDKDRQERINKAHEELEKTKKELLERKEQERKEQENKDR